MLESKVFEYGAPLLRRFCERHDVKLGSYWTEKRLISGQAREVVNSVLTEDRRRLCEAVAAEFGGTAD